LPGAAALFKRFVPPELAIYEELTGRGHRYFFDSIL